MAFKILGQKTLDITTDIEELYTPVGAGAVVSSLNLTDIYEKESYVNVYIVKSGDSVLNQKTMLFNRLSVSELETKSILAGITLEPGDKIFLEAVDSPKIIAELGQSYAGNIVIGYHDHSGQIGIGYITKAKDVIWKALNASDLSLQQTVVSPEKASNNVLYLSRDSNYYSYIGETSGLIVNSFEEFSLENQTADAVLSQASADGAFQVRLDRTTLAIFFRDGLNANYLTGQVVTIDDTGTPTFGTKQVVFSQAVNVVHMMGQRIDTDRLILTYPSANYYDAYGQMIQLSGTSLIIGTATRLHSAAGTASYLKHYESVDVVYYDGANQGTLAFVYGCSNATGVATQGYGFTGVPATFFGLTITPGTMYGFEQTTSANYNYSHDIRAFEHRPGIDTAGEGYCVAGWCQADATSRATFRKFYTDGVTISEVSDRINIPYESAIISNNQYLRIGKYKNWIAMMEYNDTAMKMQCINRDDQTSNVHTIHQGAMQYTSWSDVTDNVAFLANRYSWHATPEVYPNFFLEIDDTTGDVINVTKVDMEQLTDVNHDNYPSLRSGVSFYNGENPVRISRYTAISINNPGYLRDPKIFDATTTLAATSVVSLGYKWKTAVYSNGTSLDIKVLNTYDASYNTFQAIIAEGAKSIELLYLETNKIMVVWHNTSNELKAIIGDWDDVSAWTFGTAVTIKTGIAEFDIDKSADGTSFMVAYVGSAQSYLKNLTYTGNTINEGSEFAFVSQVGDTVAVSCIDDDYLDISIKRNSNALTYRLLYDSTGDTYTRITVPYALTGNGEVVNSVGVGDMVYVADNSKADAKIVGDNSFDVKGVSANAFGDEV